MSEPFIGEVRMLSFNFAPKGWALCNGQLLPIAQNQPLFAILGTTYGGDGIRTFALPNLQGRAPVHTGNGIALGQAAGEEAHTLITTEMPAHTHALLASTTEGAADGEGKTVGSAKVYGPSGSPLTAMDGSTFAASGGGQPHENRQPFTVVSFAIALVGIFPSRS